MLTDWLNEECLECGCALCLQRGAHPLHGQTLAYSPPSSPVREREREREKEGENEERLECGRSLSWQGSWTNQGILKGEVSLYS